MRLFALFLFAFVGLSQTAFALSCTRVSPVFAPLAYLTPGVVFYGQSFDKDCIEQKNSLVCFRTYKVIENFKGANMDTLDIGRNFVVSGRGYAASSPGLVMAEKTRYGLVMSGCNDVTYDDVGFLWVIRIVKYTFFLALLLVIFGVYRFLSRRWAI